GLPQCRRHVVGRRPRPVHAGGCLRRARRTARVRPTRQFTAIAGAPQRDEASATALLWAYCLAIATRYLSARCSSFAGSSLPSSTNTGPSVPPEKTLVV